MPSEINLGSNFEVTFNEDSGTLVIEVDSDEIQADGIDLGDLNSLQLQDASADPDTNGELQRNGSDAKVYSGGSVRNLSNVGSGGGLQDGDDFDGQGTSDFTNLNSLDTANLNTVRNAAEFADNGSDGIQAAIDDAPADGGVWVPEGGGSGANGEYIVSDPGDGNAGISVGSVTVKGLGDPIIKLADGAHENHDRIVDVGAGTVVGVTVDGNRSNQTEDDSVENQAGIGGSTDGATVKDCTVRNVQHRSIYFIDAGNVRVEDNDIRNGGGRAIQIKNTGSIGDVTGFRSDGNDIRDMSLATNQNGLGITFGDNVRDCISGANDYVDLSSVSGTRDAFLTELSQGCRALGTYVSGTVRFVTSYECGFDGRVEGGDLINLGGRDNDIAGIVKDPPNGVTIDGPSQPVDVTSIVRDAQGTPVRIQGAGRGCKVDPVVDRRTSSGPGILLEDDSNGNACQNVNVGGMVNDSTGNTTYAVQAADVDQTGLVDGLASSNMVDGVVDNPGGLTVGDTL